MQMPQVGGPLSERQRAFWQMVLDEFAGRGHSYRPTGPPPRHFMDIAIGHTFARYSLNTFGSEQPRLRVELYLQPFDGKMSWQAEKLFSRRARIDLAAGPGLVWEGRPGEPGVVTRVFRPSLFTVSWNNASEWPSYVAWFADNFADFREVFDPEVASLVP